MVRYNRGFGGMVRKPVFKPAPDESGVVHNRPQQRLVLAPGVSYKKKKGRLQVPPAAQASAQASATAWRAKFGTLDALQNQEHGYTEEELNHISSCYVPGSPWLITNGCHSNPNWQSAKTAQLYTDEVSDEPAPQFSWSWLMKKLYHVNQETELFPNQIVLYYGAFLRDVRIAERGSRKEKIGRVITRAWRTSTGQIVVPTRIHEVFQPLNIEAPVIHLDDDFTLESDTEDE